MIKNKELEQEQDPLGQAWIKVLEQKVEQNTINNEDLEEVVLKNEDLKQRIIQEYLTQLNRKRSPSVIDKIGGTKMGAEVKPHAFSIEEAKEMAKKMLIK